MKSMPAAQQAGLRAQIDPLATQAVSELKQALEATAPTDVNRATILMKIGAAYELDGKYEDAVQNYQTSCGV